MTNKIDCWQIIFNSNSTTYVETYVIPKNWINFPPRITLHTPLTISLFCALYNYKDTRFIPYKIFNVENIYTWRGATSKIVISNIQYFSMRAVIIFCVLKMLNDYIIHGINWRPFRNNVNYISFLCTYTTTVDLITNNYCYIIFSCMGSWYFISVCHNIHHLTCITSEHIYWLHWSVMSLNCGPQGFLDSKYSWKYHHCFPSLV